MVHPGERRVHPRRRYKTEITFEDELGEGLFYVYSEDISMGGLFLDSEIPLKVGTMLFLSFCLPGRKRPIRVTGQVMRRSGRGKEGASGMGVRFVGLADLARRRLQEFLSQD